MKKLIAGILFLLPAKICFCWGFYGHQQINYYATFLLPPEMLVLYKPNLPFLTEHSVDPDKRRYLISEEGPRHYIDLDRYGNHPFEDLPRRWDSAITKYSADTLMAHGIVPWWIQTMLQRLTNAFKEKNQSKILKLSAELGHYIGDAHVPLHTSSNHNGQFTDQRGIHGFWESRIPELLAAKEWDFFIGKASYIENPAQFIWARVLESAAASDSVLKIEKQLSIEMGADQRFSYEDRNGILIKQYASGYTINYNKRLQGMVERRMRQSIYAVASFWYTAWVNAGQPDLSALSNKNFSTEEQQAFDTLTAQWRQAVIKGRNCD